MASRSQALMAKITAPAVTGAYPRTRLFRLLDRSLKRPLVWVSGPAGAGKTTLVKSWLDARKLRCLWYQVDEGDGDIASFFYYLGLAGRKANPRKPKPMPLLTPEYLAGLPTFTRNFFRELYGRLRSPAVLVFDNYQNAPPDSPVHELLRTAIAELPDGFHIVCISRTDPLPSYARFRVADALSRIDGEALRLSDTEAAGIASSRRQALVRRDAVEKINQRVEGWVAGLILWLTHAEDRSPGLEHFGAQDREVMFHYFADELFSRLAQPVQDFLLRTAFSPVVNPLIAEMITGNGAAEDILRDMVARNSFIVRDGSGNYRFHALFREFLVDRANRAFSRRDISAVKQETASALMAHGYFEDAVDLLLGAEDWKQMAAVIVRHAPKLLTQGRHVTVQQWIERMPRELLSGDPWMSYWWGMSLLPVKPIGARSRFEQAYAHFDKNGDAAGVALAWSGVVDSFLVGMDGYSPLDLWIEEHDRTMQHNSEFLSLEIRSRVSVSLASALVMRSPSHASIAETIERALALARQSGDVSLQVQCWFYYGYYDLVYQRGRDEQRVTKEIGTLYQSLAATPLDRIRILLCRGFYLQVLPHEYAELRRAMEAGLRIAADTGVVILNHFLLGYCATGALRRGDLSEAECFIGEMELSFSRMGLWEQGYLHYLKGVLEWMRGRTAEAAEETGAAYRNGEQVGEFSSRILLRNTMAHLFLEQGDLGQARRYYLESLRMVRKLNNREVLLQLLIVRVLLLFAEGRVAQARRALRGLLGVNAPLRAEHFLIIRNASLAKLCMLALEHDIEVDRVRNIISQRTLIPEEPPLRIEQWPWPVKVRALGLFQVELNDKPLRPAGKVQKKPLELLKALIALGGEAGEDRLAEALWPEAEGDAARWSLKTNLKRLRRLLGSDQMIAHQEGKIILDRRFCWTDVWAFEKLVQEVEQESRNADFGMRNENQKAKRHKSAIEAPHSEIVQRLEKALQLYRGHFLAEEDKSWAAAMRERLRNRYLRAAGQLGSLWEAGGKYRRAIAVYEKGLEADPLAEEFYQRLMQSHLRLGRKAEAIKVYHRCRETLLRELGVGPSAQTEALYANLAG